MGSSLGHRWARLSVDVLLAQSLSCYSLKFLTTNKDMLQSFWAEPLDLCFVIDGAEVDLEQLPAGCSWTG